jgi:hypothetical protein
MPTVAQHRPDLSLDGQARPDLSAALMELEVVAPAHGVSEMRARLGVLPGAAADEATAVTVAGWHLFEGVGVEQTAVPIAAPAGQQGAALAAGRTAHPEDHRHACK